MDSLASGSATVGTVTLAATVFPDGVFKQTGSGFGINAATGGDDTDEFDQNEGFTFSFNHNVRLENLVVSSFGLGTSGAQLSLNGGALIASISQTGLTSLGSHFVASGTVLRFVGTGGSAFSLDSLTVSPMPEPAAFATIAGLGALGATALRRRRTPART